MPKASLPATGISNIGSAPPGNTGVNTAFLTIHEIQNGGAATPGLNFGHDQTAWMCPRVVKK